MTGIDLDSVHRKILDSGFDEAALEQRDSRVEQIRFSRNLKDLYNDWEETSLVIFASRGKRTVTTVVKDASKLGESIDRLHDISTKIPDNPVYGGLNPVRQETPATTDFPAREFDLQDMAAGMIDSAVDNGAERTSGVLYNRRNRITVKTNYNECSFETGGVEAVIRSFNGEWTGQEGRHFGLSYKLDSRTLEDIGRESANKLNAARATHDIEPGKFTVLMSPSVIGNLISYSSGFLSYYAVEAGLSCFANSMDRRVSSDAFTLVDDPLDSSGVGYRLCDDEGTLTRKNTLVESGVLRKFMHSHSTSLRGGTETTGNAGILSPRAWQLKILPGKRTSEQMLSDLDEGLLINNCWYTRYQDYRNGVFSTVPRDGAFYVRKGEIVGAVKGIRISDSIPNVLSGITGISSDTKNVKWWEEISASNMPSVLTENIGISRAF